LWEVNYLSIAPIKDVRRTVWRFPAKLFWDWLLFNTKAILLEIGFYLLIVMKILLLVMPNCKKMGVTISAKLYKDYS